MKKKNQKNREQTNLPNNETVIKDHGPIISQRSKLKSDLHIIERPDLTCKQREFIDLAMNKDVKMIFLSGPAGTTKSFLSIYCALKLLNERRVSDLIYVRTAVESASNSLGYLPGLIGEKFSVYLEPLIDKLSELLPKNEIDLLHKEERISGIPCNFLRGLNWNAKVIIADESQNLNIKELTTFVTRIGEFSKVFILGDDSQSDIDRRSGFPKFLTLFDDQESRDNGIYVLEKDLGFIEKY
jgi:phosphate starvation-inducible protein PhoH